MAKVICKVCGAEMDLPNHEAICIGSFNDTTDNVIGVLPTRLPNNKGDKRSMEMVSKVEALKAAGFTEEQINKMVGIIGFNENEVIQSDEISQKIYSNRGAMNDVSFRRKITAQYLHGHFYHKGGIQEYINKKDYNWQFTMMLEECKQLAKMEKNGDRELSIRSKFFSLNVIKTCVNGYRNDLEYFLRNKSQEDNKKCKGVGYVKYIGLKDKGFFKNCCFNSDIYSRIIAPIYSLTWKVDRATSYQEMYSALLTFTNKNNYIPLPYSFKKYDCWVDAFKGAGAYYSMMNLSQYSDLVIRDYKANCVLNTYEARCYLNRMVSNGSTGYQLYGQFKQMLKDNNFDLDKFKAICERTRAERLNK